MSGENRKIELALQALSRRSGELRLPKSVMLQMLLQDNGIHSAVWEEFVHEIFQEVWRGWVKPTRDSRSSAVPRLGFDMSAEWKTLTTCMEKGADWEGQHVLLQIREEYRGLLQWNSFYHGEHLGRSVPFGRLTADGCRLNPSGVSTLLSAAFQLRGAPFRRIAVTGEGAYDHVPIIDMGAQVLTTVRSKACIEDECILFGYMTPASTAKSQKPIVLSVSQTLRFEGREVVDKQEVEERVIDVGGMDIHRIVWSISEGKTAVSIRDGHLHIDLGFDAVVRNVQLDPEAVQDAWKPHRKTSQSAEKLLGDVEAEYATGWAHSMALGSRGRGLIFTEAGKPSHDAREWISTQRWKR